MILSGDNKTIDCQVGIVGDGMAGMAGMAAAVFASCCGLSTIQAGSVSQMSFASGCLDLFSRIPGNPGPGFEDPFEGIEALVKRVPDHPYARIRRQEIVRGFKIFTDFMRDAGIVFHGKPNVNQKMITCAGRWPRHSRRFLPG
ncbi:MAG: hypothetical protein HUN05_10775 [Desulfobacter sp.]|nr:MAG: hypothetical protein HUN05_10775 [Desulfobacter sp.]